MLKQSQSRTDVCSYFSEANFFGAAKIAKNNGKTKRNREIWRIGFGVGVGLMFYCLVLGFGGYFAQPQNIRQTELPCTIHRRRRLRLCVPLQGKAFYFVGVTKRSTLFRHGQTLHS